MKNRYLIIIVLIWFSLIIGGIYIFLFGNKVPKPDMENMKIHNQNNLVFDYPQNWNLYNLEKNNYEIEINVSNDRESDILIDIIEINNEFNFDEYCNSFESLKSDFFDSTERNRKYYKIENYNGFNQIVVRYDKGQVIDIPCLRTFAYKSLFRKNNNITAAIIIYDVTFREMKKTEIVYKKILDTLEYNN